MVLSKLYRPVSSIRYSSNFFVGQNVRLRSNFCTHPLSGIEVAILKKPGIPEIISNFFEKYGAEVTTFCETSNHKEGRDLTWSSADFVKAHVYGRPKSVEAGEREIDLTVDSDLRLMQKVVEKCDIFIDCLPSGRLEELGLNTNDALKLNSKLIVARICGLQQAVALNLSNRSTWNEDALEMARNHGDLLTVLGRVLCFSKIVLALYNRQLSGKGQVFNLNLFDSLKELDNVKEASPPLPKAFNRLYLTQDGKPLIVSINQPRQQQKFLNAMRLQFSDNLEAEIASKIITKPLSEWIPLIKNFNDSNCIPQTKNDFYYEFDRKSNKWIFKNFNHLYSPL